MSNYLVSVVTPFHNTDMKLFKKGFESLKKQTLGFEKIEWVIVVHNSEKHYLDETRELTAGCDNVKIYELNNSARTPSSPRNYALDHCTGKYIAFMDSDDSFNITAMKEITDALESTGAQIASFRAEEETEDDTVLPVMDVRAMFDQTQSVIDLHKGDPDLNKLIYTGGLTVWCKMILRDIIEEHHIRFDENITYGEDVTFSMTVLKYTDHVIILPQIIGYIYYMHHGSLAQDTNHTPDGVMTVCDNFSTLFDVALEGGYPIERLAWPIIAYLSDLVMFNPDLPDSYKTTICDKMRKYLEKMDDLPTDAKFFTPEAAAAIMSKVRHVILGQEVKDGEVSTEEGVLLDIVEQNKACELGVKYGFGSIRSTEDFRRNVPLSDYGLYGPLVNLSTRIGESNLFTTDKVIGYFGDFGSMQNPQKYPVTAKDYAYYTGILMSELNSTPESTLLMLASLPKEKETHYKDDTYLDSVYGATARALKDSDVFTSYRREYKYGCITSPEELVFPSKSYDLRYGRALFALADPDVSQIITSNTWALFDLLNYIEKNWQMLVDDLESGTVSQGSGLDEEIRMILGSKLQKLPERAAFLKNEFKKGFDEPIIPRIWPGMNRIIANSFGEYEFYTAQLRAYSGDIAIDNGYYLLPSAVVAKSAGNGSNDILLLKNNAFIELLEVGSNDTSTVLVDEAKPGATYEMIVTNHSGLYRFRTGVLVEAKEHDGQIGFSYVCRREEIIRIKDRSFITNRLVPVIDRIEKETGIRFADYSTAESDDFELIVYLEPKDSAEYDKAVEKGTGELLKIALCELPELKEYNTGIKIVQPETQLLLRDRRMMDLSSGTDQMRPVRVLINPKHIALYNAFSK
ncbi:MAG: GH3 auxin-responsive promoter family protein [Lachnospiraceae bacterium]|nr:GH3 auxin-responsive promoter family protein [Lachnospiraceae bacterium]